MPTNSSRHYYPQKNTIKDAKFELERVKFQKLKQRSELHYTTKINQIGLKVNENTIKLIKKIHVEISHREIKDCIYSFDIDVLIG